LVRVEKFVVAWFVVILIFSISYSHEFVFAQTQGPREEDVIVKFYENLDEAYGALKTGQIDILRYELTMDLLQDALSDPNIVVAPVFDSGMYEFDINNNCSIPTYPGIRSPTNYQGFRQALAFLVDKNYIIDTACAGFAERIDQPIGAPLRGFRNVSYWYPNYPYEFNSATAASVLDVSGFEEGSTPNPYYDPAFPGSAEYIRVYPVGHETAGQNLDPLIFYVRSDDYRRLEAGRELDQNLRKMGIPTNRIECDSSIAYPNVMDELDYHLYTGGWSPSARYPPTYIYSMYHHDQYRPSGSNIVTGFDCDGNPNYPLLNDLLEAFYYSYSYADIVKNIRLTLGYITEQCITIPLFSARSFWTWNKNLLGVVNGEIGPDNIFTFMNAYKEDGSPIRCGLKVPPDAMNIVYSQQYYDHQCLSLMNLYSGLESSTWGELYVRAPYDLSIRQPGFIKDWNISTWVDPSDGQLKTKITQIVQDDCYFVEPVTGERKGNVNASHIFFSAWYLIQVEGSWWHDEFSLIHHIDIVNSHMVELYFDNLSFWNSYRGVAPIIPIDTWLQQPELCHRKMVTFVVGMNLTAPGRLDLDEDPIWIEEVTADGLPLTAFVDYNIIGGQLEVFIDLDPGMVVNVDFWYPENSLGYTPGSLPWQTIFEGAGMYYAVAFTPGVGGALELKRNTDYWMETPPLGEVDFVRKLDGTQKVDIYDVVMAVSAYGSSGFDMLDPDWFPGADLAPSGGIIDIFDLVTITGKYGTIWDYP
jgi:hypothetical protein